MSRAPVPDLTRCSQPPKPQNLHTMLDQEAQKRGPKTLLVVATPDEIFVNVQIEATYRNIVSAPTSDALEQLLKPQGYNEWSSGDQRAWLLEKGKMLDEASRTSRHITFILNCVLRACNKLPPGYESLLSERNAIWRPGSIQFSKRLAESPWITYSANAYNGRGDIMALNVAARPIAAAMPVVFPAAFAFFPEYTLKQVLVLDARNGSSITVTRADIVVG